ncbi:ATP-binding protein [Paenibacillus senegalimassiliensis]|uniref:ATP-binding protein n=1 Tax=Paenibacillus senegalimassiliensis TaxID=1737426 RepID=UPI00073E969D|nr:ATP-binding protein [Paenibacillus senegalimassiliensis]
MSITFTREDWKMFRNMETLCQKAGVHRDYIPRLVVKELVDNALDISGSCELHKTNQNSFVVADKGDGINPDLIETYFSINRPMVSSKLLRLPSRGALGNGLRVVTGAVISTGGSLFVSTHGKTYALIFNEDGTTTKQHISDWNGIGTKIEVNLGSIQISDQDLTWGKAAIRMAHVRDSKSFKGKTSTFWYTSEAFYEVCNAAQVDLLSLAAYFHKTDKGIHQQIEGMFGSNSISNELSFVQTEQLLEILRSGNARVKANSLGQAGDFAHGGSYKKQSGTFAIRSSRGRHDAEIPFVAKAWVEYHDDDNQDSRSYMWNYVNSTVAATDVRISYSRKQVTIWSGGLYIEMKKSRPGIYRFNLITPYMPITSDGKAPDFRPMSEVLEKVMLSANKEQYKYRVKTSNRGARNEKELILSNLPAAIQKTSGNGTHIFSLRQLYYGVRPYVMEALDKEPEYNYFCRLISEYENDYGEIEGMYRDPRGIMYHPHRGDEIPLGTIAVQNYARPEWTFNKIIFIEKEGYFASLKDVKFPERYDCALITSKGFANRAVKDVFDLLGETDEEITFFCVHDADAAGTMIYETLQHSTISRPGRKFKVINLGLDPEEAIAMGLQVESFKRGNRHRPTASYINYEWEDWLQESRVELNAMTTPQFIQWLENKMEEYGHKKVIPNDTVLQNKLQDKAKEILKQRLAQKLLVEAGFDQQFEVALGELSDAVEDYRELRNEVEEALSDRQDRHWTDPVQNRAEDIVKRIC